MSDEVENAPPEPHRKPWIAFAPVAIFAVLAIIFAVGLTNDDPRRVPSVLLGKPVPDFQLPGLDGLTDPRVAPNGLSTADLKTGEVTLVNVWASWCGPCRLEHPFLMKLSEDKTVRVVGINYKDQAGNARRFLGSLGNPYSRIGTDAKGTAAVDWGVYGVPETFMVDGDGIIRYKWIGPLTQDAVTKELLPRIRSSQSKSKQ